MPAIVHIQVKLTESFKRTQGQTTENSIGSIDEVAKAATSVIAANSLLGGGSVRSSAFSASIATSSKTCSYTGRLRPAAAPQIVFSHVHGKAYGAVAWPDQTGSSWKQVRSSKSPSSCPGAAEFNPVFGPVDASPPVSGFTTAARFYSAVFPIPAPSKRTRTIAVSMHSSPNIPGETDVTSASGSVTISY